jgi:uncharacterized protein
MEQKLIRTIEENPIVLATSSKDGKPNASVAAFVKVKDNKIIITNNYMKTTIDNIKHNHAISLVVWDKKMDGYKIEGTAEYYEDGEWIDFIKKIPQNKDEPCNGAIVIKPKDIISIG